MGKIHLKTIQFKIKFCIIYYIKTFILQINTCQKLLTNVKQVVILRSVPSKVFYIFFLNVFFKIYKSTLLKKGFFCTCSKFHVSNFKTTIAVSIFVKYGRCRNFHQYCNLWPKYLK